MQALGVQNVVVTEDEDGMRLDRWFKRRVPTLALSHLAKICRKGEVRLDGKRVETSTRVAAGQKVRVPPLNVEAPKAPAVKRPEQSEADARAIRDMILLDDRDLMVLNKPYGLAVQGGSGTRSPSRRHAGLARQCARRAAGAGASPRPRHFRRAAHRQDPQNGRRSRRDFPLALGDQKI